MSGTALTVPDRRQRGELAEFVARVVQLEPAGPVRLCRGVDPDGGGGLVTAWAATPFAVLATRAVPGELVPADVVVPAAALLTALAVERADTVDPGSGAGWRAELPAEQGWAEVGERAAADWASVTAHELRAVDDPAHGPSERLLDTVVDVVPGAVGPPARVPLRCLVALSALGLLDGPAPVRVCVTRSWLRLDTPGGAVVRRRTVTLPLLV